MKNTNEQRVKTMKVRITTGVICALIVIMLLVFTGLGYLGVMSIPMGVISAIAKSD